MKKVTRLFIQAVMVSAMLSITGCVVAPVQSDAGYHSHDKGYGPPSHAPAHGHRYNHQGQDVVYDSSLGVYLVVGYPNYYLYDNYYYKRDRDHWSYSRYLNRGWHDYKDNKLPPGLSRKYESRKKRQR